MLIDKPRCNFKNCRYCFDSNCYSADKYENCKLTDLGHEIAKLTVDLDNAKRDVAREVLALIWDAFQSTNCYDEFVEKFDEITKKYTEDET